MSDVESLEGHYFELRGKLSTCAITPDEYRNQVARLWFEDATGHTWMIGAHTGHWYVYKNDQWMMGEPPRDLDLHNSIICPRCGETVNGDAQFCGHCGFRLIDVQPVAPDRVEPVPTLAAAYSTPMLPAAPVAAQPLRLRGSTMAAPAVAKPASGLSRNLMLALSGLAVFGVLFLCLGTIGGLLLLRNGAAANAGLAAPSGTLASRVAISGTAAIGRTATPTGTPPPTVLVLAVQSPTATTTPVVIATVAAQSNGVAPTPIVVVMQTETPTPTAAPVIDTPTRAPTETPTETVPPTITPTPADTSTPTDVPPTATPRPATATAVPRPSTATPAPAAVLAGRIAYTIFNIGYRERPAYDVYLARTDGSSKQLIAPRRRQPAFSADGSRLLVMGMENEREKLLIRDLSNGSEREVSNTPIESMQPSWSPAGGSILYASTELSDRQSRLYVVDARGAGESRPWLKAGGADLIGRFPTWLGNGQIVYTGCDKWGNSGQCGIIRVNPDGLSPATRAEKKRDAKRPARKKENRVADKTQNHRCQFRIADE